MRIEMPSIYVGTVPDEEITEMPSDVTCLTDINEYGFFINDTIEGLGRPDADVITSSIAGTNASKIAGSYIRSRNIVFDVLVYPVESARDMSGDELLLDVANERMRLYRTLPFDANLRFYFKISNRKLFIDGYVEKLSTNYEPGKPPRFTVSIICPFPWFQSVSLATTTLTANTAQTVAYAGDIPAGFTFYSPTIASDLSITIGDETFAYSGAVSMPKICTIPGQKSFTGYRTSIAGGAIDAHGPAIGAISSGSKWPTLSRKNREITVSCAEDSVSTLNANNSFTYRNTYSGV